MPSEVKFAKEVVNSEQPEGQVATRLRELVSASEISSSRELKRATNYAGSTLSEAMSGRKRQNRNVITQIVRACVTDADTADAEIENLVAILGQSPETLDSHVAEQVGAAGSGGGSTGGLVEKPLDEDEDDEDDDLIDEDDDQTVPSPTPVEPVVPAGPGRRLFRGWVHDRRTFYRYLAVAVVIVVILAAISYGVFASVRRTYISDGSTDVIGDPAFATIMNKIEVENNRVLSASDGAPVVSVAYAAPFPAEHTSLSDQLLRELQGAYMMQLQRNEAGGPDALGGPPRVQLLVANLGEQAADEATVVEQLQDRAAPGESAPLVAVIGLDQNLPKIKDAVNGLGVAGIPMVAGRLAGDDFSAEATAKGFFSVAPPVSDQVAAAANYLGGSARKPLLVEDTTTTDLYGQDVAKQFVSQFQTASGTQLPAPVPFNSNLPGLQTAFAQVLPAICSVKPDVVFFAGRGRNLPDFIRQLGDRLCTDVPVTVVTLSDGRELADALIAENASGANGQHQLNETMLGSKGTARVQVILTAQAHPGIWSDRQLVPERAHTLLSGTFNRSFQQEFPGQRTVDDSGDVIMGHDAMQVVIEAINRSRPPQSSEPVTAGLVRQALGGITPYTPVYGASGRIAYKEAGYPLGKNIPITQITPYGQIFVLAPLTPPERQR